MAEDDGTISVMEHAFARAKLPTPASDDMTLGSEAYDMYTHHMLKLGGITVERVGTPAYGDEDENTTMNCMVQIVEEEKLKDMMTIDSLENISMCENNEALGLHVKLHNAYAWKVTILADIPERGAVGPGSHRPSRKRSAAEEGKTVVRHQSPAILFWGFKSYIQIIFRVSYFDMLDLRFGLRWHHLKSRPSRSQVTLRRRPSMLNLSVTTHTVMFSVLRIVTSVFFTPSSWGRRPKHDPRIR